MNCYFVLRSIISAKLVFALALIALQNPALREQESAASKHDEQLAQKLMNDSRFSFEDLLHGKPGAVANAKRIFALTSNPKLKERVASILLSIGVKDQIYRDYLEHDAREALADQTPWPTQYDEKNQKIWNPEFLDWCKKRGSNPIEVLEKTYYVTPMPWYFLAASGDSTFYTLFIDGLHSQNQMIISMAAKGLAKLQDCCAIEPLISAGRHASGEARFGIGEALLYFKSREAQAAAEEFMGSTNRTAYEVFRKHAQEEGVKALFEW